jgi:predicted enzyme related to lactoylglutathione lyase
MEPAGNQRKLEEDGFADQEAEATLRGRLRETDQVAGALEPGARREAGPPDEPESSDADQGVVMGGGSLRWPNWIGVVAEDFESQRRFYGDVLGLQELDAGEGWVQFDLGFPNLLELLRRSDDSQYDRSRFQVGFAVEDIHEARRRLVERGAEAISEIDGGPESGGHWCYFRDPEGNVFEISQRLGDRWANEGS